MKSNADNLICEYSESVVAYLYDELPVRETSIFEAHLEHCILCTDEFAAVADTRYSVYEWHKEAFVPLATPRFVVPQEPLRVGVWAQIAGLFATMRPTLAFAGGMAAVLLATFVGFNMLGPAETDIAANSVPVVQPATITVPTPSVVEPQFAVDSAENTPQLTKTRTLRATRTVVKPTVERKPIPKTVEAGIGNPLRQARKAPALSNDVEVEDESLRLTDLFDEVGG
jgi:anti-sigma factor RsiW